MIILLRKIQWEVAITRGQTKIINPILGKKETILFVALVDSDENERQWLEHSVINLENCDKSIIFTMI